MRHKLEIAIEDGRFVYSLGEKRTNKFWFRIDAAGEEKLSDKELKEFTNDLVKAYDLFPEMVAVLEEVLKTVEDIDEWWIDCPDRGGIDTDKIEELLKKAKGE